MRNFYDLYGEIGFFLLVFTIVIAIYSAIKDFIKQKKLNRQMELEMEMPVELVPVDSVNATVLEKDVVMHKSMDGKFGGHTLIYNVKFLTTENEKVEYSVPEKLFGCISVGQKGTLATIDGEFFDFGDGEEI